MGLADTPNRLQAHIRWAETDDAMCLASVARACLTPALSERDFKIILRHSRQILLAQFEGRPIGFLSFDYEKKRVLLRQIAVLPGYRRSAVGRSLIDRAVSHINPLAHNRLVVLVSEENLGAQLFFKAAGFEAVLPIQRDSDGNESYKMLRHLIPD